MQFCVALRVFFRWDRVGSWQLAGHGLMYQFTAEFQLVFPGTVPLDLQ